MFKAIFRLLRKVNKVTPIVYYKTMRKQLYVHSKV